VLFSLSTLYTFLKSKAWEEVRSLVWQNKHLYYDWGAWALDGWLEILGSVLITAEKFVKKRLVVPCGYCSFVFSSYKSRGGYG